MSKLNKLMRKLQTAILNKNVNIKINTRQFFSQEKNRMVTCYSVTQKKWSETKCRMADQVVLTTCSTVEVVKFLAKILEELRNEPES